MDTEVRPGRAGGEEFLSARAMGRDWQVNRKGVSVEQEKG
jgi:hypothetical protein